MFRRFGQLSSSICWQAIAVGRKYPWLPFVGVEFLSVFVFEP